ncbi:MAG: hypothetical protein B6D77_15770 [gamma proteobacterium symbiont of Ctena orbiculata]|nr:MAG: hypothetical protein B6D77_15770 [gamma proteobacterium symbiont of Ctena orbiculata]PVV19888.1 MAG: hypothetical protein B6D78_12015 [gamma proteobacterium symbiont of Ctena orbiculata]PVV26567.1 MAG: hypothetical protein B6D79_05875 [gamma proteobacterium symbiont of Ctena orbiculata]
METPSPYATPKAEILSNQEEFGSINILSAKGRIGRLRYIAYTIGITLLCYLIMGGLSGLFAATLSEDSVGLLILPITALGIGAMFFINIVLTIQRCHDFNMSGWLSLSLIIPLVPLIFWFIPGTVGANKFGLQPPPNRGGVLIIAIIFVMILVLGILAAIAIPAYQDYLARATAAGM